MHSQQGLRIDPSDGGSGFSLCLKQFDLSEDCRYKGVKSDRLMPYHAAPLRVRKFHGVFENQNELISIKIETKKRKKTIPTGTKDRSFSLGWLVLPTGTKGDL